MRTNDTAHKKLYKTLLSCLQKIGILPYTMIIAFSVSAESCKGALCEESPEAVPIYEKSIEVRATTGSAETADIFVFEDDKEQNLETYQRVSLEDGVATVLSTKGEKLMAAIINWQGEKYEWADVATAGKLMSEEGDLRKENPDKPVMTVMENLVAGKNRNIILDPVPILSEIRINSLRCDFSGKAYYGEKLTEVKVYLTNVNSRCELFRSSGFTPCDILNSCGLKEEDLNTLEHPQILYKEISEAIGQKTVQTGTSLWCYPNDIEGENGGNRFTRLVIEGKIGNENWFYPININREEDASDGKGIGRNCLYSYDIVIRSTGVTDPEIPADSDMVTFDYCLLPWEETDEQTLHF